MHSQTETPRGDLLAQYVRARITDMLNIDIGLFTYDRHNALYYFIMNADEQIYMRYGGRDGTSPEVYLDLESFELALKTGLELHDQYNSGTLPRVPRPRSKFPRDIPLVQERIIKWGRCVECHLIDDYELQGRELARTIDRKHDLYRYPDIRRIGIHLDIPKGLRVKEATGAAKTSGLRAGDTIMAIAGKSIYTFADLQHEYNEVERDAHGVELMIERGGNQQVLDIQLPKEWWWTDLYHRFLSIEPLVHFENRPLTIAEKKELGLDPKGFASEITDVEPFAKSLSIHSLEPGDIIFEVDGAIGDPETQNCRLHIKLHKKAGDTLKIKILRNGNEIETAIKSERQSYRKESR